MSAALALCQPVYTIPGSSPHPTTANGQQCSVWTARPRTTFPVGGIGSEVSAWIKQDDPLTWPVLEEDLRYRGTRWGCTDFWARLGLHVKVNRCAGRIYLWRTKAKAPEQAHVMVWGI